MCELFLSINRRRTMIAPRTNTTMAPLFAPSAQLGVLDEMKKITENSSGKDGGSRRRFAGKGHWKPSEDVKLKELVALHGPKNWNMISEQLPGRTGKSCRLRWVNQLDPLIKTTEFSREEDETLMAAHMVFGNQWSHIAKFFPGRTDNGIKNHWHVLTARRRKHVAGVSSASSCSSGSIQRVSGDSANESSVINESTSLLCMNTPNSVFRGEEIKMSIAVADDCGSGGYCNKEMETCGGFTAETSTSIPLEARISFTNSFKNSDPSFASSQFTDTDSSTTISRLQPLPFIDFLGVGK